MNHQPHQQYQFTDLLAGAKPLPKVLRPHSADVRSPHDIAIRAHANATAKAVKVPLNERAERYMSENPTVYAKFCEFVRQLRAAGKSKIGAKMIAERMRWESLVSGNDGFKVNNSYISYMVRRWNKENPNCEGVFETRQRAHA